MTASPQQPDWFEDQLEAYLAGRLDHAQCEAFEERLRSNPELAEIAQFERRTRDALRQIFVPPPFHAKALEVVLQASRGETSTLSHSPGAEPLPIQRNKQRSSLRQFTQLFVAGSIAVAVWGAVLWQLSGSANRIPQFSREPLVSIHQRAVIDGFQPYYICDDPDRFALTFSSRQGVPLRLAELPAGTKMLGLSYLGGLSRHTTAMLGVSNGKEVTVFVDRRQEDTRQASPPPSSGLRIFRKELDSLVLYEVTPLEQSAFLDALEITDPVDCETMR
jgi:hypothetical protein